MSKHDAKIKVLLAKVEEQQAGLGTKPKASWITNGLFKFRDSKFFNLNTVKDPQQLVDAVAHMLSAQADNTQAADMLGVPAKTIEWDGYFLGEWVKDFKRRIEIIQWDERKAQLEATKAKLKALRSEDAKTGDALDELEKQIL